jgi:hypothetical protein
MLLRITRHIVLVAAPIAFIVLETAPRLRLP